jgi:hypothetical protein
MKPGGQERLPRDGSEASLLFQRIISCVPSMCTAHRKRGLSLKPKLAAALRITIRQQMCYDGSAENDKHLFYSGKRQDMRQTCIVVSDLHVGDGTVGGDQFFQRQQEAWEGLLAALGPDGPLGRDTGLELVVNGDGFDFLLSMPAAGRQHTDPAYALPKVERMITAHPAFFAALRRFLAAPERQVTFTIGNHDVDLCFADVRARLRETIGAAPGQVRFCLSRAYRPFPDVELEHGCQFDPWNRVDALWDGYWPLLGLLDDGEEHVNAGPESAPLPWGTRYYYQVFEPSLRRLPYLDRLIPSLPFAAILALLCLLAPDLVSDGAVPTARMLGRAPSALAGFAVGNKVDAAALFSAALPDVLDVQRAALERLGIKLAPETEARMLSASEALRATLSGLLLTALEVIFSQTAHRGTNLVEYDSNGKALLDRDASVQIGLIGHTHYEGTLRLPDGRLYLDTGTWTDRLFQPDKTELSEALARWLHEPEKHATPLRDATRFPFVLLQSTGQGSTSAQLCEWVGGRDGAYRNLRLGLE